MPNKTIYVREADREVWEKAERLAGGSVSALITEALRRYVEETELKEQTGMETLEVELSRETGYGWEETSYPAQFVGRWLVYPDPDETRAGYDPGTYYGVALTQKGNIAVYNRHVNDMAAPSLNVYSSFEEAERAGEPGDILAMASREINDGYVQTLDI